MSAPGYQTTNRLEKYGGGCVWLFLILMFGGLLAIMIAMGINTHVMLFIPLGIGMVTIMFSLNVWMIYKQVTIKKKIASTLFKSIQSEQKTQIIYPSLWKFTITPRIEFSIQQLPAQIKITHGRRSAMNQLLAIQLEGSEAKLNTELNPRYALPGWKGHIFRIYFFWDHPTINNYSFFIKTPNSTQLSNSFIALSNSRLREYKSGIVPFDQSISAYTDSLEKLESLFNNTNCHELIEEILRFNSPYATKLEIGTKGVFISTILTNQLQGNEIKNIFVPMVQLVKRIQDIEKP
jgi:hypothetical protein